LFLTIAFVFKKQKDSEKTVNLVEPDLGQQYYMTEEISKKYTFLSAELLLVEEGKNICICRVEL